MASATEQLAAVQALIDTFVDGGGVRKVDLPGGMSIEYENLERLQNIKKDLQREIDSESLDDGAAPFKQHGVRPRRPGASL